MTQLYLFEKEEVMKTKDYVADIMQQLYDETYKNGTSITPKVSTILGTILAKYDIQAKKEQAKQESPMEDLWNRYMETKGGQWQAFWSSLSKDEKDYIEVRRQHARDKYYAERGLEDNNRKSLLKG